MRVMNTVKHVESMTVEELEQAMRDPEQWDWKHPVSFDVSPDFGMYYTLRFTGEESNRISDAAEAAGLTIIDYMQQVILAASQQ